MVSVQSRVQSTQSLATWGPINTYPSLIQLLSNVMQPHSPPYFLTPPLSLSRSLSPLRLHSLIWIIIFSISHMNAFAGLAGPRLVSSPAHLPLLQLLGLFCRLAVHLSISIFVFIFPETVEKPAQSFPALASGILAFLLQPPAQIKSH